MIDLVISPVDRAAMGAVASAVGDAQGVATTDVVVRWVVAG